MVVEKGRSIMDGNKQATETGGETQEDLPLEIMMVGDEDSDEWDDGNTDQAMEYLARQTGAAVYEVMDDIDDFTTDAEVLEDFEDRQNITGGSEKLMERLDLHHSLDPELAADDIDAVWEDANAAGEETVGGTSPTPDQDRVDDLGKAVGLTYTDDEELNTDDKMAARDENRWELDLDSEDSEYNEAVAPEGEAENLEDELETDQDADEGLE